MAHIIQALISMNISHNRLEALLSEYSVMDFHFVFFGDFFSVKPVKTLWRQTTHPSYIDNVGGL